MAIGATGAGVGTVPGGQAAGVGPGVGTVPGGQVAATAGGESQIKRCSPEGSIRGRRKSAQPDMASTITMPVSPLSGNFSPDRRMAFALAHFPTVWCVHCTMDHYGKVSMQNGNLRGFVNM